MRFIDAEKLQELFLKRYDELLNLIEAGNKTIYIPSFIGKLINDTPTADVKPVKRGEWIKTPRTHLVPTGELSVDEYGNIYAKREHNTIFRYRCSCCGLIEDIESDFCPNCGADTHKVADIDKCDNFIDNSRTLNLPCVSGDKIYAVDYTCYKINEIEVYGVEKNKHGIWIILDKGHKYLSYADFGVIYFFNRKEAEKALAERKRENNA